MEAWSSAFCSQIVARQHQHFRSRISGLVQVRCYPQQQKQQQPEPEPDFNDISCLADLKDPSIESSAPRFVPTYSRIGRRGFAKRYELFPGGPVDLDLDKDEENNGMEGATSQELVDTPKGPTHREMIAARRHYLKRQARRGLLPQPRTLRKRRDSV